MKAQFLDHEFWTKTNVKLEHEGVFAPSHQHPVNSVKIPYELNLILGDIISLEFAEEPDYFTYKKLLKTMAVEYNLISTKIVKNFREEFKPRDELITETFNWPTGALCDWNLTKNYRDCLLIRKDITEMLDQCHEFSDSEEENIDNLLKIYDSYDPEDPESSTLESKFKIHFDLKAIRKQNKKYDIVAKDEKSSDEEYEQDEDYNV